MSFKVSLGMNELLSQIDNFGEQVKAKVALEGVAAMAKVIYDEARLQAPISEKAHVFYGRNSKRTGVTYRFEPGNLRDAIYRVYQQDKSSDVLKLYRVSWNHKKAPYGHMVEFGTSRAVAHPFLGAAMSQVGRAIAAGKVEMGAAVVELSRQQ